MVQFFEKYKWSNEVKIITIVVVLTFVGVLIIVPHSASALHGWLPFVLILPIFITALFTPISLSVERDNIKVEKLVGAIVIPISDVCSVVAVDKKMVFGSIFSPVIKGNRISLFRISIKTLASSGLFGYLGQFWNSQIGHHTMYITQRENLVLIKTKTKSYVFNCRDIDGFSRAIGLKRNS